MFFLLEDYGYILNKTIIFVFMNPQLSIIIPFYGKADKTLLQYCIDSINNQAIPLEKYELIITDGNGKNLGAGAARNNGILQANGEYILFVDADDYLFPNSLLHCLDFLEKEHPDVLSFKFQKVIQANQSQKKKKCRHTIYTSGAEFMAKCNFMGAACIHFVRKELLIKHQLFFPENTYHEDEAFVALLYFYAQKTIITNWHIYAYFQHPQSITYQRDEEQGLKHVKDFYNILSYLRSFLETEYKVTPLQQKALQRRIHFLTIDYIQQLILNRRSLSFILSETKKLAVDKYIPLPANKYSWKYTIAQTIINLLTHL